MKYLLRLILIVFLVTIPIFFRGFIPPTNPRRGSIPQTNPQYEKIDGIFFANVYILVLKSTRNYEEAIRIAQEVSNKIGLEFDNEGIEYSKEKGIYFSEDFYDVDYRGKYLARHDAGEYISLENSKYYHYFVPGYILVIAGIYNDLPSANQALSKVKKFYEGAYIKKTVAGVEDIY